MYREYINTSQGQIHLRRHRSTGIGAPLICLHPTPYSGMYFETVADLLQHPTEIIAPDYPGYGGSDPGPQPPTIELYATALLEVIEALGIQQPDLLGFHTGCLVATEMALQQPDNTGRLILIDVPFYTGEKQKKMYAASAPPPKLTDSVTCLEDRFNFNVSSKLDHLDYDRAFKLFAEQLRPASAINTGFAAAFSYDTEAALKKCKQPGVVLATQSSMLEASKRFAAESHQLQLTEVPEITRSVFEAGAKKIAIEIDGYLKS